MMTLDSNPSDAPGCIKIINDDGRDALIQTDLEYPGVASTFGWSVSKCVNEHAVECEHDRTDGTIGCPRCGMQPGCFIEDARQFLDDNDGATAEDPGYFE